MLKSILYSPIPAYPELFALVGAKVPDFRGLFLRGQGGNSAGLGVQQGDAIRNITGSFHVGYAYFGFDEGAFYSTGTGAYSDARAITQGADAANFDASRQVPTASENRPVNKAVRYFIRAAM